MEFIVMVHPDQHVSTRLRQKAHSHAARAAHATSRRQRMAQYNEEKKSISTFQQKKTTVSLEATSQNELMVTSKRKRGLPSLISPNNTIPVTISNAFLNQPLANFLNSLTAQENFMFGHYVKVVLPYMNIHCPKLLGAYHQYMRNNWLLFSSNDVDLLKGFLLSACRHLSLVHLRQEYTQLAIQYKLRYIQSLRESISSDESDVNPVAVTRALVLAFDEIMIGDLEMAQKHVLGASLIVQKVGGTEALGLSQLVTHIFDSCIFKSRVSDWAEVQNEGSFMKPVIEKS